MNNKSLKSEFYALVIKIISFTLISSLIVYLAFVIPLYRGKVRPSDYYLKYLDEIEKLINMNKENIIKGNLVDLKIFDKNIKGEVIDPTGKHLYGDFDVAKMGIDYWKTFNRDFVKNQYIYRYVPIVINNRLVAIYVLKAPFGFFINNKEKNPIFAFLYVPVIISPLLFFILYLFVFTRRLYMDVSKNINILLKAAEKVSNKNFDFTLEGLKGKEFIKIQEAFNEMIRTIHLAFKSLWDLDSERRKMLSSIAHDIITPITIIKGQIEIVEDLKDYSSVRGFMQIINNNCNRIINLANNLSLLGKIENPDFLVRRENVNLNELLRQKEEEIKMMAASKGIKVYFDVNLKKDSYILDENLLLRILDNILYNSLRFTTEGEIKLIVFDKDDKIHFLCLDTGKGFNLRDIDNLFKAYYQGEDFKDHFGLGLYIAKRIVNKFGGEIKAYNRNEGGAAVEFFLKEMKD